MYQAPNTQLPLKSGPTSHLYLNTCTEFPGGCKASASRLGGAQPACTTWEYVVWKPKQPKLVCSLKLVSSDSTVLLRAETLCRSRVQLSPVQGQTCYSEAIHRHRPPNGPHKASFTALQLNDHLLKGWKWGEVLAPYTAYVAHYTEQCAQWAPGKNGC